MKHLKGYKKKYFSLAIIAMYSTLYKLSSKDTSYIYHKLSHKDPAKKTSPPINTLFLSTFY